MLQDSAVFVQAARIVGVGMHAKTTYVIIVPTVYFSYFLFVSLLNSFHRFLLGLSKSAAPQAEGG